jgi:hypothetical protein
VREPNCAFEGTTPLRAGFDLIHAFGKPPEEVRRIQLLEGGFLALERQLGQSLAAKTALADDGEQGPVVWTLDFEARPGTSVDRRMDPEVAIGVVELEKEFSLGERLARLLSTGGDRRGQTSQRERDGQKRKQAHVVDRI